MSGFKSTDSFALIPTQAFRPTAEWQAANLKHTLTLEPHACVATGIGPSTTPDADTLLLQSKAAVILAQMAVAGLATRSSSQVINGFSGNGGPSGGSGGSQMGDGACGIGSTGGRGSASSSGPSGGGASGSGASRGGASEGGASSSGASGSSSGGGTSGGGASSSGASGSGSGNGGNYLTGVVSATAQPVAVAVPAAQPQQPTLQPQLQPAANLPPNQNLWNFLCECGNLDPTRPQPGMAVNLASFVLGHPAATMQRTLALLRKPNPQRGEVLSVVAELLKMTPASLRQFEQMTSAAPLPAPPAVVAAAVAPPNVNVAAAIIPVVATPPATVIPPAVVILQEAPPAAAVTSSVATASTTIAPTSIIPASVVSPSITPSSVIPLVAHTASVVPAPRHLSLQHNDQSGVLIGSIHTCIHMADKLSSWR